MLLVGEGGEVLEGTQTNFFVVGGDGVVRTAGEGVLEGTVRRVVLELCEREGVRVELSAPLLREARTWRGAFITSTSRLLLPVEELAWRKEGCEADEVVILSRYEPLVARLEELVDKEVAAHSEFVC